MKRVLIGVVASAFLAGVVPAVPQNLQAIKERQQIMKGVGGAAGTAAKMLKGEAPFDLSAAQAALKTFADAARTMPGLFPDDSKSGGDTRALPAIWADKADVDARFAKLGQDSQEAMAAIKDQASFVASFPPLFKNCGGCHEKYRAAEK